MFVDKRYIRYTTSKGEPCTDKMLLLLSSLGASAVRSLFGGAPVKEVGQAATEVAILQNWELPGFGQAC